MLPHASGLFGDIRAIAVSAVAAAGEVPTVFWFNDPVARMIRCL